MTTHPSDTSAVITLLLITAFGLTVLFWPAPKTGSVGKAPTSPHAMESSGNAVPNPQTPATD